MQLNYTQLTQSTELFPGGQSLNRVPDIGARAEITFLLIIPRYEVQKHSILGPSVHVIDPLIILKGSGCFHKGLYVAKAALQRARAW